MKIQDKNETTTQHNHLSVTMQPEQEDIRAISPWKDSLRQLRKNPFAIAGMIIILFFILIALLLL